MRQVLVAENLDQARAVKLAARIHAAQGGDAGELVHIAHLSAPAKSGELMQRCRSKDRLCAINTGQTVARISRMPSPLKDFYLDTWPVIRGEAYLSAEDATARILTIFLESLGKYRPKSLSHISSQKLEGLGLKQ